MILAENCFNKAESLNKPRNSRFIGRKSNFNVFSEYSWNFFSILDFAWIDAELHFWIAFLAKKSNFRILSDFSQIYLWEVLEFSLNFRFLLEKMLNGVKARHFWQGNQILGFSQISLRVLLEFSQILMFSESTLGIFSQF